MAILSPFSRDTIKDIIKKTEWSTIRSNKKITYFNNVLAFDIETTSFSRMTNGEEEKCAIMYEWTLAIEENVIYGRSWRTFKQCMNILVHELDLQDDRRIVIYVHNLSFEFQFFRKHFAWKSVFSLKKREPVRAVTIDGMEFRCSLKLSGMSLAKTADNLHRHKIKKLVGDLDYNLIRHGGTKLTEQELKYCENDVLIIIAYIHEMLDEWKDISQIPMTKTGIVRNYCRNMCFYEGKRREEAIRTYKRYRELMNKLKLTADEYNMCKLAFMGGFTHANVSRVDYVIDDVSSYDLTSSYPTVMVTEKFPMSSPIHVEVQHLDLNTFENLIKTKCCIFTIKFFNIEQKVFYENYISESHCNSKNAIINNGRIQKADEIETTITEIDFFIIKQMYKWESMQITKMIYFHKDYLPKNFVLSILNLYKDKTELKDVKGKEVEYGKAKEQINSCYGMTVTDIVRDEIIYDESWGIQEPEVEKAIAKYNNSRNRFLYYPWGIWVTAYARANLFSAINAIKYDYVYSDTDSVKIVDAEKHKKYFEWYNATITNKLLKAVRTQGIDEKLISPVNKYGKSKPLGLWSYEGIYEKFKTLGAKRYLYSIDGHYTITVAGLGKQKGIKYLLEEYGEERIFEEFKDGMYIPPEKTGKLTHTYIDYEQTGYITDYQGRLRKYNELSSLNLSPAPYDLSISAQFKAILEGRFDEITD